MAGAKLSSRSLRAASALAVLCDHALLKHVTKFQSGIPLSVHLLVEKYYEHRRGCRVCLDGWDRGPFWASAMRIGDLRDVQVVSRMREMPAYADLKDMKIDNLLGFAVRCGRHDTLQWWTESETNVGALHGKLLALAVQVGRLDTARWFLQNQESDLSDAHISKAMACAAAKGDVALVSELTAFRPQARTPRVFDVALMHRHWDLIRYLHDGASATTVGCTPLGMDMAAEKGFLDVVQFLHENRTEGCTTRAMDEAARFGNLDIVAYLHDHRREGCMTRALDDAAHYGHLDVVRFLHENRSEGCTTRAMDDAAAQGHLDIVRFLHENRTEGCTKRAMNSAAHEGHLAVVRYLYEQRTEGCTNCASSRALQRGHVDLFSFLREHPMESCSV